MKISKTEYFFQKITGMIFFFSFFITIIFGVIFFLDFRNNNNLVMFCGSTVIFYSTIILMIGYNKLLVKKSEYIPKRVMERKSWEEYIKRLKSDFLIK